MDSGEMKENKGKLPDFIDMMEMRHGWIQQELDEIFDIITKIEIFEGANHRNGEIELIDIGICEINEFLERLKSYRNFLINYS